MLMLLVQGSYLENDLTKLFKVLSLGLSILCRVFLLWLQCSKLIVLFNCSKHFIDVNEFAFSMKKVWDLWSAGCCRAGSFGCPAGDREACVEVGRKWTLFRYELDRFSFLSVNSGDNRACSAGCS